MTHARQTIREGFVTTATGLTTTGNSVINGQKMPRDESELPIWIIYPGEESISEEEELGAMGSSRVVIRELQMICLGIVRATSTGEPTEDTLDDMLEELETAVGGGIGVSGVLSVNLTGVTPDYDGEADNLYASIECTFNVLYRTTADAPGTIV